MGARTKPQARYTISRETSEQITAIIGAATALASSRDAHVLVYDEHRPGNPPYTKLKEWKGFDFGVAHGETAATRTTGVTDLRVIVMNEVVFHANLIDGEAEIITYLSEGRWVKDLLGTAKLKKVENTVEVPHTPQSAFLRQTA